MHRQLLGQHRHGDGAAPSDDARNPLRRPAAARCLRLSDPAENAAQAWLQTAEMDLCHGSHQQKSRRLLGGWRLQLVQRPLILKGAFAEYPLRCLDYSPTKGDWTLFRPRDLMRG